MKPLHFAALASVTALSLLGALASSPRVDSHSTIAATGKPMFPDLGKSTADLAKLEVRAGEASMIAVKNSEGEFVEEATGYPLAPERLRELLHSMSLAQLAERKTADSSRHAELSLAAPDAEAGAGREIRLQDAAGRDIAALTVGKSDYTLGGALGGQYLRLAGEDQTWLARARIELPSSRIGWFDTALLSADATRIRNLTISPSGEDSFSLNRDERGLTLALGSNEQVDEKAVERATQLFTSLRFTDVRKAAPDRPVLSKLEATLDGAGMVTLSLIEKAENGLWLRAHSAAPEVAPAERFDGYEFLVSNYSGEPLTWARENYLKRNES